MAYSEAAKHATYRYRARVRNTSQFKAKQHDYNVAVWARIKSNPDQLDRDRARGRANYHLSYHRDQDKILTCVRKLFR